MNNQEGDSSVWRLWSANEAGEYSRQSTDDPRTVQESTDDGATWRENNPNREAE